MQTPENLDDAKKANEVIPDESRKQQQQSDPQLTELKGFFDKTEKIEPKLEDEKEAENSTNKE